MEEEAQKLITALNQQYATNTLRRNMEIMLWFKVGKLSQAEIARKYHLSRERVRKIVEVWTDLFKAVEIINGD